jgi:hypothetical protein
MHASGDYSATDDERGERDAQSVVTVVVAFSLVWQPAYCVIA